MPVTLLADLHSTLLWHVIINIYMNSFQENLLTSSFNLNIINLIEYNFPHSNFIV